MANCYIKVRPIVNISLTNRQSISVPSPTQPSHSRLISEE